MTIYLIVPTCSDTIKPFCVLTKDKADGYLGRGYYVFKLESEKRIVIKNLDEEL